MINEAVKGKRSSFLAMICLAYKNFGLSFRRQKKKCVSERDLLFLVFTGTTIIFLANIPVQVSRSLTIVDLNTSIYLGLIAFVSLFFIPLFLYLISGIIFLICKLFGGTASFIELRLALFWSLNVAGPLLIINGFLRGFFFNHGGIDYVSMALQFAIAWIISTMIAEAEQFRSKFPTLLVAVFFVMAPQFMPPTVT